jgi:hypothetical protein
LFGGSRKSNGTKCSVGYVLFLNDNTYFEGKVFLGQGTNNLGEFTTLLLLIRVAHRKWVLTL